MCLRLYLSPHAQLLQHPNGLLPKKINKSRLFGAPLPPPPHRLLKASERFGHTLHREDISATVHAAALLWATPAATSTSSPRFNSLFSANDGLSWIRWFGSDLFMWAFSRTFGSFFFLNHQKDKSFLSYVHLTVAGYKSTATRILRPEQTHQIVRSEPHFPSRENKTFWKYKNTVAFITIRYPWDESQRCLPC